MHIKLTAEDLEVVIKLRDNATTQALLTQLPLEVKLSDYAHTEKIAYLPKKLPTKGAPPGYSPEAGELTLYAPWGNLAIFYKKFGYASGLVPLGTVVSGLSDLAALDGDVVVRISR